MEPSPSPDMHWYAVHTKPRQEREAEAQLLNQGFQVFLPRIRLKKRLRGHWSEVVEPLFPRYLFVSLALGETNTAPIRSTRGVSGLVRFGNQLRPVPDAVIGFLRLGEDEAGVLSPERPSFLKGDRVRVLEGPLAGLEAVFDQANGERRALILVEILSRPSLVAVPWDAIVPIEP